MGKAKFKNMHDDSKILGIGSLFRNKDRKSWAINIDFNGGSSKSMQFSNIPVLARKRVLNPTRQYNLAGLPIDFLIENAQAWEVSKASECPAYHAHKHGKDGNQLCFVAQAEGTKVFIPQLEMARILFFHDPFLARLSLQHSALIEDFAIEFKDNSNPLIVVREGAEYPVSYFNQDDNRRFLSWVLLDTDARASFESISTHLIKKQYQKNNYQYWNFQFIPPFLRGAMLSAMGWGDNSSNSFFVWEVIGLDNIPSEIEGEIDFYHPGYERKVGGKPTNGDSKQGEAPEQFYLDDEELSDVDKTTLSLISQQVIISFRKSFITNRIESKTKLITNVTGNSEKEVLGNNLSPNEKEESGSLPGGAWNNLDDQTDDESSHIGKFKSFAKMVQFLVDKHGFKLIREDSLKLPKVGYRKKHLLVDNKTPRRMAIFELEKNNLFYTLLEIDTSDDITKLSTMLLKSKPGWVSENENKIIHHIVKKSLSWPTDYFRAKLGENTYTGIPHPKSKHSGTIPPEAIEPWAVRIVNWIERSNFTCNSY